MAKRDVMERFWSKVDRAGPVSVLGTPCWIWTAGKNRSGYGLFGRPKSERGSRLAHRYSFEAENGPVPAGLECDHRCSVRACVRPDHVEAVTHAENVRRGKAVKTHCLRGHDLAANFQPTSAGRRCAACVVEDCAAREVVRKAKLAAYRAEHAEEIQSARAARRAAFMIHRAAYMKDYNTARYAKVKAARPPPLPRPPRTHCKHGHELKEGNLTVIMRRGVEREVRCRTCCLTAMRKSASRQAVSQ